VAATACGLPAANWGRAGQPLANGRNITLPGNHGTAVHTPEFEAAVTSFLDGGSAAGVPPEQNQPEDRP